MSLGPALRWTMGGDTSQFNKAIGSAETRTQKFKKGLQSLGGVIAAIGLSRLSRSAIDLGSQISDLAVQLQIGTDELQVLEFAARKAGVQTGIMERALRNANNRTQEAINGNKRYGEALERLNIDLETFAKLPVEQKLVAIAEAQAAATNKQAAFNDVAILLGERAGPKMAEILSDLATNGFPAMARAAEDAGEVMDKETIAKMDAAADTIESYKRKLQVLTAETLTKVVPGMQILANGLGFVGEMFGVAILNAVAFFKAIAANTTAVVAPAIESYQAMGLSIRAASEAMKGDFSAAAASFSQSSEMAKTSLESLVAVPGKIKDSFGEMVTDVTGNVNSLGDDLERRAENIETAWGTMWEEMGKKSAESADVQKAAANEVADVSGAAVESVGADAIETITTVEQVATTSAASVTASAENAVAALQQVRAEVERLQSSSIQSAKVGTAGDSIEGLSTDKLEYMLRDQRGEFRDLERSLGPDSAFGIGGGFITAGIQNFINQIERELETRRQFASVAGTGAQDLLFDPFQAERLARVTGDQSEQMRQTGILAQIQRELELQNARATFY